MSNPRLVAVFSSATDLLAATRAARDRGCRILDAYTPYAVHGLDDAMGLSPTRLPYITFLCGLLGVMFILWFQHWTTAVDWPLNVGGKPWNSLPAFVPITFEIMILCAGLGSVATLLLRCKLVPGKRAALPARGVTSNRFALVLSPDDASFSFRQAAELCRSHNAVQLTEFGHHEEPGE